MSILDNTVPLRKLDDATLVKKFVEGDTGLLANQNLRVEAVFGGSQLLSKRDGVLASLKLDDDPPTALVRANSPYQDLVHQALEQANFLQLNHDPKQGFWNYERRLIPDGYCLHSSEARLLWKEWWLRSRQPQFQGLDMGLLVMIRDQWYPIRDMASSNGMIYVKTLVKEIVTDVSGHLAWLSREDSEAAAKNGVNSVASSSSKNYRRLPGMPVLRSTAHTPQSPVVAQQEIPRRHGADENGVFGGAAPVRPHDDLLESVPVPKRQAAQPLKQPMQAQQEVQRAETETRSQQRSGQPKDFVQRFVQQITAPRREKESAEEQPEVLSSVPQAKQVESAPISHEVSKLGDDTTILETVSPAILRVALAEEETILEMGPVPPYVGRATPTVSEPEASPKASHTVVSEAASLRPEVPEKTIFESALADFSTVLKFQEGRIHVATVLGELVIEGEGLKFWLNQANS